MADIKKVLMIYTGGTIGMLPGEDGDPQSALRPASWGEIENCFNVLDRLDFTVDTLEMEPIDSSNMFQAYWIEIAITIRDRYGKYDGFVILHGTDTMAYTASALSFLFENLGKPVILTGSQLPVAQPGTDAVRNLTASLKIAASDGVDTIPEVCVLFNNKLFRGNRCRKVSSAGFDSFDSPNMPPLAVIGDQIELNKSIIRESSGGEFYIYDSLNNNVMLLDIFPGISGGVLRSVFDIEGLRGLVLRTFGAGNAPTTREFLGEIDYACNEKNLVVVNITQCSKGAVDMGLYEAGLQLQRLGVISGFDMTPEAALVKMMFLFGQWFDSVRVKEQMQSSLRGELLFQSF